ncbi:hypothetical protein RIEGSTA812A_PEG_810 [invertebrate metagenome]|uniref:Uncharacterized protein n=1 Tax=invertebrate metagenome TaxID=1711999 RepID=A0A484H5L9_9ZZZZ
MYNPAAYQCVTLSATVPKRIKIMDSILENGSLRWIPLFPSETQITK